MHKSDEVIEFLEKCNNKSHMACSFDIKDLWIYIYLSLPHRKLLLCVEGCIDNYGSVAFQNNTGLSVWGFFKAFKDVPKLNIHDMGR